MSEERPETCNICNTPEVWCTCGYVNPCRVCGKVPEPVKQPNGCYTISCYHDDDSRIVAAANYDEAVRAWNNKSEAALKEDTK